MMKVGRRDWAERVSAVRQRRVWQASKAKWGGGAIILITYDNKLNNILNNIFVPIIVTEGDNCLPTRLMWFVVYCTKRHLCTSVAVPFTLCHTFYFFSVPVSFLRWSLFCEDIIDIVSWVPEERPTDHLQFWGSFKGTLHHLMAMIFLDTIPSRKSDWVSSSIHHAKTAILELLWGVNQLGGQERNIIINRRGCTTMRKKEHLQ